MDCAVSVCVTAPKITGAPQNINMYPVVDLRCSGLAANEASVYPSSLKCPLLNTIARSAETLRKRSRRLAVAVCVAAGLLHALESWLTV